MKTPLHNFFEPDAGFFIHEGLITSWTFAFEQSVKIAKQLWDGLFKTEEYPRPCEIVLVV